MEPMTLHSETSRQGDILYMSMELSNKIWKLTFSDGSMQRRRQNVEAGALSEFERALLKGKKRFGLNADAQVYCCYEAGRDGFWIHRYLTSLGIENRVLDPASIEVPRRYRRVKTDKVDGENLLRLLFRLLGGERKTCSVVNPPTEEDEDARRVVRELGRLRKERTGHRNRILGLLATQGVKLKVGRKFLESLGSVRLWNGVGIPPNLQRELSREYERLNLVESQLLELCRYQREQVKRAEAGEGSEAARQVAKLMKLRGIGPSAWVLVLEFFSWRDFRNGREVGSLCGLTGTPSDSGEQRRELGISKAGSSRVRSLMVELSWCWLRHQPQSKLSRWYTDRFAAGGRRMRRVGIVAFARRLLVDLWRYVDQGRELEGAEYQKVS